MAILRRWLILTLSAIVATTIRDAPAQTPAASEDPAALVAAAEQAFRSGKPDEAIAAYDRAQAAALAGGDRDRAFDLAYLAAAIEHQRGRHCEALQRFRQAALSRPDHPRAPEAHRLAGFHAGFQKAGQSPTVAQLLQEYLEKWPTSPDANRVRRQLGLVHERQRNWTAALAAYKATTPDDPEYAQSIEAVGRCYQAWIGHLRADGKPTEPIAAQGATWLEAFVLGPDGRLPEIWAPVQFPAALAAARLWLETAGGAGRAETLAAAAIAGAGTASAPWRASAQVLLVAAVAAQGRTQDAGTRLAQLSAFQTQDLLDLLQRLERLADAASAERRRELGALEIRTLELLAAQPGQFDDATRRTLERFSARALADAGRTEQALAAYEDLGRAYPRDGEIQEDLARALSECPDAARLETARTKWLEIVGRSEPGSPRWFRAEYQVALLDYRLGNALRARQILQRLEVLYPSMGGPELKTRFADLARQLNTPGH
jgi:tetratricopeptide (TPR) repeat protein